MLGREGLSFASRLGPTWDVFCVVHVGWMLFGLEDPERGAHVHCKTGERGWKAEKAQERKESYCVCDDWHE